MTTDAREKEMVDRVTAALDKELGVMGAPVLGRLAAMRAEAVELAPGRRPRFAVMRWAAAGGLAMVAVIVIAVSLRISPVRAPQQAVSIASPDDVELLISRDRMEMYQDLDFYRWLDEGGRNGG